LGSCSWTYSAGSYSVQMQMVEPSSCSSNADCNGGTLTYSTVISSRFYWRLYCNIVADDHRSSATIFQYNLQ
jgi:hypothetical protein